MISIVALFRKTSYLFLLERTADQQQSCVVDCTKGECKVDGSAPHRVFCFRPPAPAGTRLVWARAKARAQWVLGLGAISETSTAGAVGTAE